MRRQLIIKLEKRYYNIFTAIENNRSFDDKPNKWPIIRSKSNYKLGIGDTLALVLIKQVKSEPSMIPRGDSLVITTQPSIEKPLIQRAELDQMVVFFY